MKTKRKKTPRATKRGRLTTRGAIASLAVPDAPPAPAVAREETIHAHNAANALKLVLPFKFRLLGYYSVLGNALYGSTVQLGSYALVMLDDPDSLARFSTYEVRESGLCILAHDFGESEYETAVADFLRRADIGSITPKKATKAPSQRQQWEQTVALTAAAQQQKGKSK